MKDKVPHQFGEFLINAQGEDVVAGTRTPQHITKKARKDAKETLLSMEESMPIIFSQLEKILKNFNQKKLTYLMETTNDWT